MSRNLGNPYCYFCESLVELREAPRPLAKEDAGFYFEEFVGRFLVAQAECPACEAKYLAWVGAGCSDPPEGGNAEAGKVFDLSFRSSFNDEPGEKDLPNYEVAKIVTFERKGPAWTSWHEYYETRAKERVQKDAVLEFERSG